MTYNLFSGTLNPTHFTSLSAKFNEICIQDMDLCCHESFRKTFLKICLYGDIFPKRQILGNHLQRLRTSGRDIYEMNTNRAKSPWVGQPTECWLSISTVGINSKSFPWSAGCVQGTTFLDIAGSSVWRIRRDVANSFAWRCHRTITLRYC